MRRASPLVRIPDFTKTEVDEAEAVPGEGDAISLSTSDMRVEDGFAQPINAILREKHHYQRLRFKVAPVGAGITGDPDDVEVTIWERTPDGEIVKAGVAELAADGTFSAVEIDNYDARYACTVSAIAGGTSPEVSVGVWVQGVYAPTYVATPG